jgi:DNA replication factor GINS
MDIDELLVILEKNRTKLTKLDDDFYQQIRKRILELEELRNDAAEEEISRIDDEIRTIRRIQRKIFETRTSKIIRIAWAKVCGESVGVENLTNAEKNLLFKLTNLISEFRDSIMEGKFEAEKPEQELHNAELLRIKTNVGRVEINGKTYKLSKEDVVTLPKSDARALIKADAAEPIDWRNKR